MIVEHDDQGGDLQISPTNQNKIRDREYRGEQRNRLFLHGWICMCVCISRLSLFVSFISWKKKRKCTRFVSKNEQIILSSTTMSRSRTSRRPIPSRQHPIDRTHQPSNGVQGKCSSRSSLMDSNEQLLIFSSNSSE